MLNQENNFAITLMTDNGISLISNIGISSPRDSNSLRGTYEIDNGTNTHMLLKMH